MVLQWYVWAAREFGWSMHTVDNTDLAVFFELVTLNDKMLHPEDYVPAEYLFGHFN